MADLWRRSSLTPTCRNSDSRHLPHRDGYRDGLLDKGIRAIVGLLKDGAKTLIEATAKGVGEAMVKGG